MTAGKNDQDRGGLIERAFYGTMGDDKTGPGAVRAAAEALTEPPYTRGGAADA